MYVKSILIWFHKTKIEALIVSSTTSVRRLHPALNINVYFLTCPAELPDFCRKTGHTFVFRLAAGQYRLSYVALQHKLVNWWGLVGIHCPLPFTFKINGSPHWWIDGDWWGFTGPPIYFKNQWEPPWGCWFTSI